MSEVVDSSRSVDLRSKFNGKIEPPGLPQSVLRRGRLARQLTVAAARPVTVVSGGPGWGKTVAAASWAVSGTAQHPVGWLSLDNTDDNPRSFWSNLVTALVATGAVRDRSPLLAHDPGESFGDADLEGIWVQLADLPAPVSLVIDDFQVITSGLVLAQLGRLVAKLPPTPLRLVLLSRSDPMLPLHGLRTRGDLAEIRSADLAFTADEAAALLEGRALHLQGEQLKLLMRRTAGWPAGVQAAALSIDPADIESGVNGFCVPGRAAADYLVTGILSAMSPGDQEFLLKTSIADMVNGELADHLTGRTDSRFILEKFFDGGFFTVKRGQDGWYSYQPMLRDLLARLPSEFLPANGKARPVSPSTGSWPSSEPG